MEVCQACGLSWGDILPASDDNATRESEHTHAQASSSGSWGYGLPLAFDTAEPTRYENTYPLIEEYSMPLGAIPHRPLDQQLAGAGTGTAYYQPRNQREMSISEQVFRASMPRSLDQDDDLIIVRSQKKRNRQAEPKVTQQKAKSCVTKPARRKPKAKAPTKEQEEWLLEAIPGQHVRQSATGRYNKAGTKKYPDAQRCKISYKTNCRLVSPQHCDVPYIFDPNLQLVEIEVNIILVVADAEENPRWICSTCSQETYWPITFTSKQDMERHERLDHPTEDFLPYECPSPGCHYTTNMDRVYQLRNHIKNVHGGEQSLLNQVPSKDHTDAARHRWKETYRRHEPEISRHYAHDDIAKAVKHLGFALKWAILDQIPKICEEHGVEHDRKQDLFGFPDEPKEHELRFSLVTYRPFSGEPMPYAHSRTASQPTYAQELLESLIHRNASPDTLMHTHWTDKEAAQNRLQRPLPIAHQNQNTMHDELVLARPDGGWAITIQPCQDYPLTGGGWYPLSWNENSGKRHLMAPPPRVSGSDSREGGVHGGIDPHVYA